MMNQIKTSGMLVFTALAAAIVLAVAAAPAEAQTLSKEDPQLIIEGQTLNTTADDLDIDLTIHPNDNLTDPSGQETISTSGATDIDINEIPYEGITVVIQNKTVTVTTNPVSLSGGDAAATEAATPTTITEADE